MIGDSLVPKRWPASLVLPPGRAAVALYLGLIGSLACLAIGSPEDVLPGAVLSFGLAWASMVDIDRFILPDVLTLGLVVVGLGDALNDGWLAAQTRAIGAAAGYGALALVAEVYRRLRGRSGLGMGDAKLLAVGGAWLGWTALPAVLLIASLGCLALVGAQAVLRGSRMPAGPIPFGPYLAAAIWLLFLFAAPV
jgi:leader peptidase (prepilin peptidase)/N-methyltransferase